MRLELSSKLIIARRKRGIHENQFLKVQNNHTTRINGAITNFVGHKENSSRNTTMPEQNPFGAKKVFFLHVDHKLNSKCQISDYNSLLLG